jgi:hypothetical protein
LAVLQALDGNKDVEEPNKGLHVFYDAINNTTMVMVI